MKANTNISLRPRQTLALKDLRGVDFTSSPMTASPNRAVDMRNWINENGVLRKRYGWRQKWQIPEGARINGMFYYEHEEHKALLIHAGKALYRIVDPLRADTETECISDSLDDAVQDIKSSFFYQNGRCYILCGSYIVYGSELNENLETVYQLSYVADRYDTYIPTTTVAIGPREEDTRKTLEGVNRLSSWRRNELAALSADDYPELVGVIVEKPATYLLDPYTTLQTIDLSSVSIVVPGEGEDLYLSVEPESEQSAVIRYGGEEYGYLSAQGVLELSYGFLYGAVVTFRVNEHESARTIEQSLFGTTFGIGGYNDRLFIAGDPEHPNVVYYSEMDDYTYFPDNFYAVIGAESAPVTGFSRLSDGVLAIHKRDGFYDPTIYYMTANLDTQYSEGGQIEKQTAVFSFTPGVIGEGCVSAYATANLSDDPVFLSGNGLFGLVLPENTATSSRFAKERSYAISSRLRQHADLSKAVGVVYKNRYYLALDGVCYVADARYKFYRENDADASFNYEWWYWDNVPARVWLTLDGVLYFGTDEGRICRFDEEYTDRTFLDTEIGDLTVNEAGEIVCNVEIGNQLLAGDRILLHDGGNEIYAELGWGEADGGRLLLSEETCMRLREGMCVYVQGTIDSTELIKNIPYTVAHIDYELCAVTLSLDGAAVSPTSGIYDLLLPVASKELYVSLIDEDWNGRNTFGIRETPEGEILRLVRDYNGGFPLELQARVTHHKNIVAEWLTPYMDMGSNMISKTMTRMTVAAESGTGGVLWFGYDTRKAGNLKTAKQSGSFSFDNLSFTDFSFDTGFATSYTVKKRVRDFNYIRFRFLSDDEKPCGFYNFSVEYKIHKMNGGLR